MLSRIAALALIALAGASLAPQTTAPAEFPYTGVVIGKNVHVRSGPGLAYYACAALSYPAKVRVVSQQGAWLKILPPRKCFSLISKDYVRREGAVGTVTGTNVRVRAGSELTPKRMETVQLQLDIGKKVTILGELDGFYKIVPPAGVYWWISSQYVKSADAGPVTTLPTRPAPPGLTTTRASVTPAPAVGEFEKEKAGIDAVEKLLNAELKKPIEQQDLSSLLQQYKAIELAPDSPLKAFVESRVKFLQGQMDLAKDRLAVERLLREIETTRAQMAAEREAIRSKLPSPEPPKAYAVEGVLSPSGLFPGGATGPKRYIIGRADRSRIYAYLQCSSGVADLEKFVGTYVGVTGRPLYDEKLGMYVVEVERIRPIESPGRQPATAPAPTTRPSPLPVGPSTRAAPAPTTKPSGKAEAKQAKPPLPPTGLPVARPTTNPSSANTIDPKEYQ